jgi:hypothetical protein
VLPDFDDQVFALDLLENKHVLVAPGVSFNVPYRNCFRITNLPEPQVLATVFSASKNCSKSGCSAAAANRRRRRKDLSSSRSGVRRESPEVCAATAAGHIVLTPSTELAAALTDMVERMHVRAGHDIWPTPQIRDFSSWRRERHAARQLDTPLPRLLSDIEERELWRQVILASDTGKTFLEPAGAARAARRARHAMSEYGIRTPRWRSMRASRSRF